MPKPSTPDAGGDSEPAFALVLAAGSASRFGRQKLLEPLDGRALVLHALEAARAAPVAEVVVVTGADREIIGSAIMSAETGMGPPVRLVHAAEHKLGLSQSLSTGIAALPDAARCAVVFLGDMPRVPHALAPRLIAALDGSHDASAPTCRGRRGNPVALSSRLFPQIARLTGDRGAGGLIAAIEARLALVPEEDPGVLQDIDVPGDLA